MKFIYLFKDLHKVQLLHIMFFLFSIHLATAQIMSGPMLGYIELRTAKIWCEVVPGTKTELIYWKVGNANSTQKAYKNFNKFMNFETQIFDLVNLEPGTKYMYQIISHPKPKSINATGEFSTQELWKWRKPAPDFSFITGSCAYFNERVYDRPGKPYGNDSSIFISMAKEDSDFMLWLGDSWYTREVDYGSEWGLWYRASRDRNFKVLQPLLKNMSNYAIWDDHDYGPNNEGISYIFKEESRKVFQSYFANPTYGMNNQGIYSKVSHNDVDVFFLDNRTWRSSDRMPSYIQGKINEEKIMYGKEQLTWLKNALLSSTATFKIIATGSQIINAYNKYDCLFQYPAEYKELMEFLQYSKVNGVVFLTGDIHFSEINKLERDSLYPIYDVTVSPLTSGVTKLTQEDRNNKMRINGALIEEHNYGKLSFLGNDKERKLVIEFLNKYGESKYKLEIPASELKNKKQ
ncbi:MAG: alkaline phosphatase family protein [Saprospiraceae bacterium]|nr:alkaline phosphatase family protein [Saprospiraceae bacterium]